MKKFIIFLVILVAGISFFVWKNQTNDSDTNSGAERHMPSDEVVVNGTTFTLKFSSCKEDSITCLNEYYKEGEYDTNWTELFTIVYAKNQTNAIEAANYIGAQFDAKKIYPNEVDNSAVVLFTGQYRNSNGQFVIEQNIAKVAGYEYGEGVVSQQYAKRYYPDYEYESINTVISNMGSFFNEYFDIIDNLSQQQVYMQPLRKW